MLTIRTKNAVQAWRDTFAKLFNSGSQTDNDKYYRDELVVIQLDEPSIEPADPLFPMPQSDLAVINDFITSGRDEEHVTHEWTKLYHHRIFDEPNSQVKYLIEKIRLPEPVGEAVMSIWDKNIDQSKEVSPCTLVIWARKKHGKLELHIHAHSVDAYKKLLMNLQEFVALHLYLAAQLGLPVGTYYHVIDSCHIHHEDLEACRLLASRLAQPQQESCV